MDELIFQFLLQAGYPRASVVVDPALLTPGGAGPVHENATTYVVVDPDTAERLAAIEVVEAIDADALQRVATEVGRYADHLGGREMQGFVIRVDPGGANDAEQVQFYRVWPNPAVQQLSAKTFPDLDALRVARRLSLSAAGGRPGSAIVDVAEFDDGEDAFDDEPLEAPGRASRYVPAALLILLALADAWLVQTRGASLLNPAQALLAVGAAGVIALGR